MGVGHSSHRHQRPGARDCQWLPWLHARCSHGLLLSAGPQCFLQPPGSAQQLPGHPHQPTQSCLQSLGPPSSSLLLEHTGWPPTFLPGRAHTQGPIKAGGCFKTPRKKYGMTRSSRTDSQDQRGCDRWPDSGQRQLPAPTGPIPQSWPWVTLWPHCLDRWGNKEPRGAAGRQRQARGPGTQHF